MIKVTSKKILLVYLTCAVLLLTYIFSLTVFSNNREHKRHYQSIQLLHEADISLIDTIIIQTIQDQIILERKNNMWLVSQDISGQNYIPADTQMLKNLFVNLASTHKMSKAGKKSDTSEYGLSGTDVKLISLFKNGQPYQNLYFGKQDFTQTGRYFITDELNSVFLFDSSFDNYLSASSLIWCDPYIISNQLKDSVFQMGDIQSLDKEKAGKILELRHGGFAQSGEIQAVQEPGTAPVKTVSLDTGDKSTITLKIYNSIYDENEYLVKTEFNSHRLNQSFSYYTKISSWTYSRINEITL